jgi:hypothetical protein
MPTDDYAAPRQGSAGPNYARYADPGFPPTFGIWSGRIIMVCAIYLTLPIQVALYPIAGAAGLAAGALTYVALLGPGAEQGAILSWSWFVCFAALVPMMRIEIRVEDRFPTYRKLRLGCASRSSQAGYTILGEMSGSTRLRKPPSRRR